MKRKPKITDVAKASGFSIATVSHVINGSRPVSAGTAAKVNAAIAALGYVPDSSARSFKTGRHHLVGYIAPDIGNRFFSLILEELEDALALVAEKLAQGLSRKDAVKLVSKETGFAKNALYDAALKAENL